MKNFLKWLFNMKDEDFYGSSDFAKDADGGTVFAKDLQDAPLPYGEGATQVLNPDIVSPAVTIPNYVGNGQSASKGDKVVTLSSRKPSKSASKKLGVKATKTATTKVVAKKNKAQASARA
jgi:hypothetical protein